MCVCVYNNYECCFMFFNMHGFNFLNYSFPFRRTRKIIKALSGPMYNGKYLRRLVKENLGETTLNQTLTNVVIPTFDIKRMQPTIFSSYEVHSSSLPNHNFDTKNKMKYRVCWALIKDWKWAFRDVYRWWRSQAWKLYFQTYALQPRQHPLTFPPIILKLKTTKGKYWENLT